MICLIFENRSPNSKVPPDVSSAEHVKIHFAGTLEAQTVVVAASLIEMPRTRDREGQHLDPEKI